jgi:hypothetical protein
MSCEKCWSNAFSIAFGVKSQTEVYLEIVEDCNHTPKERAGQWWDESKQCDTREQA